MSKKREFLKNRVKLPQYTGQLVTSPVLEDRGIVLHEMVSMLVSYPVTIMYNFIKTIPIIYKPIITILIYRKHYPYIQEINDINGI